MAAVANNPEFAGKANVPQSVGAEFMKADKRKKNYRDGGLRVDPDEMLGDVQRMEPMGPMEPQQRMGPQQRMELMGLERDQMGPAPDEFTVERKKKKKKKKKKVSKSHYYTGGKVLGSGAAQQGVRKTKMIRM